MNLPDNRSLKRQARGDQIAAENAAVDEIHAWYQQANDELAANDSLTPAERARAERDLVLEVGRRSNRAMAKAKRDNTVPKLFERQARAEIEDERKERGRWTK